MKKTRGAVNGKEYTRLEFDSFEELEDFFLARIFGNPIRSKVIGKVIIVEGVLR